MYMLNKALLFTFFFLFIFLTPAFAYLDTDIDVAWYSSYGYNGGLSCSNLTGTLYCYTMTRDASNNLYVERYNSTWQDRQYCDTGLSSSDTPCVSGMAITNSTHIIFFGYTGELWLAPVDNIAGSGTCSAVHPSGTEGSISIGTSFNIGKGGYYGNSVSGWNYWGGTGGILNSTYITDTGASVFWDTNNVNALSVPNASDNSTVYGMYDGLFFEYVNGAFTRNINELSETYGTANSYYGTNWDTIAVSADTTYIFWYSSAGVLYRANFTESLEIGGGSSVTAVSPISNETALSNPAKLHAIVYSVLNGSVSWYIDGVLKANSTFITDVSSNDAYYTTPALTTGHHTWEAVFYDSNGDAWTSGEQEFNIGLSNIAIEPVKGTAGLLAGLFSVNDQETANNMFAILVSLCVPIVIILVIVIYSGKSQPTGNTLVLLYIVGFMGMIVFFTIADFLNPFYTVLFIVTSALGLWAIFGGKIGGG